MKIILLSLPMLLHPVAASAQNLVPPEVVRFENARVVDGMRVVTLGNAKGHYTLFCNLKADAGCITPERDKNYLLFDANTRWKMPGAAEFITLAFVQNMTVTYTPGENIGL